MRRLAETFPPRRRQRGIIVLMMLVLGALVGVLFFTGVLGNAPTNSERDLATRAALAKAKAALIAHAVTYMDSHPDMPPGFLPCPEIDGSGREGSAPGVGPGCNNVGENALGRLPWFTLGIEPLRDGYNECLWYAVSGNYKNNPAPYVLNWNTNGTLRAFLAVPSGTPPPLDSNVLQRAVAVVIAPGPAVGGQSRAITATAPIPDQCGGNRTAANYLETSNSINNAAMAVVGDASFVSGVPTATFNDRVITVTAREVWDAIQRRPDFQDRLVRLTQAVAECIANYPQTGATGTVNDLRLPWASSPGSFEREPTYYNDSARLPAGRAPYSVNSSNAQIGRVAWGASTTLLGVNGATTGKCPASWTTAVDNWWSHWRDHVFYAVSRNFAPDGQATNTACVPASACITVGGLGPYAAVVMFAGPILANLAPTQIRFAESLKYDFANYLEERNRSANTGGNNDYQKVSAAAQPFNDILYCIGPAGSILTAAPCP